MTPVTRVAAIVRIRAGTDNRVIATHNRWHDGTEGCFIRQLNANISPAAAKLIKTQVVDVLVRPTLDRTLGWARACGGETCRRSWASLVAICAVAGALYVVLGADDGTVVGAVAKGLRKADVTHVAAVGARWEWAGHESSRWTGDRADRRAVGAGHLEWHTGA